MFFHILGSIAEFPVMWTHLISERTMDGLAAARARGRTGGQKPKLGPRQAELRQARSQEAGGEARRALRAHVTRRGPRRDRPRIGCTSGCAAGSGRSTNPSQRWLTLLRGALQQPPV